MEAKNKKEYNLVLSKEKRINICFELINEKTTYQLGKKNGGEVTKYVPTTYCEIKINDNPMGVGSVKLKKGERFNPNFARIQALSKAVKGNDKISKEDKEEVFKFLKNEVGFAPIRSFKEISNAKLRPLNEGEIYTVKKIKDITFNGKHPNSINEGYSQSGIMITEVVVGMSFYIQGLATTVVTEIVESTEELIVFKTLNSNYTVYIDKF